jgi:hypothetical protein
MASPLIITNPDPREWLASRFRRETMATVAMSGGRIDRWGFSKVTFCLADKFRSLHKGVLGAAGLLIEWWSDLVALPLV